jgi:hypothetical protein
MELRLRMQRGVGVAGIQEKPFFIVTAVRA